LARSVASSSSLSARDANAAIAFSVVALFGAQERDQDAFEAATPQRRKGKMEMKKKKVLAWAMAAAGVKAEYRDRNGAPDFVLPSGVFFKEATETQLLEAARHSTAIAQRRYNWDNPMAIALMAQLAGLDGFPKKKGWLRGKPSTDEQIECLDAMRNKILGKA
jgi:hypothetical protein